MKKSTQLVFGLSVFCLLISGTAGLVYEVLWTRYLALFLGHTSYAVVAVLVAFMGGLALGNAWLGARADRSQRPLALYAWLEIGIAAYALMFPYYYEVCHEAYLRMAQSWQPGGTGLLVLKFAFSLMAIIVPTILMGGTLPVLTRLVTRSLGELRGRVAALYFINSVGAIAGCFLADFWWIPSWGLQTTVWAGAVMNLVAGAAAMLVSGYLHEGTDFVMAPAPEMSSAVEEKYSPAELRLAVISIGLSGFVAMLYEVVWTRILALTLCSSTHAFSLMLITFITGIAAGAWWVGRWKKLVRSMDAFGWAELALAVTLLGSMFYYQYLPYWFVKLAGMIARREDAYLFYEILQAAICFVVMFIPTLCLGMTLPLASRIATSELAQTGRSVGMVFSVNTLGTVLGAAITGLWLMPWLGMAHTLALGVCVNALVGFVMLGRNWLAAHRLMALAVGGIVVTATWLAGGWVNDSWQRTFTLGLWRYPTAPASITEYHALAKENQLSFYRDGAGSTVSLHTTPSAPRDILSLRVNGKVDASNGGDIITQLLLGHVPALLHPHPRQALVIGLGSGMTCGAVLRHATIEHLDAVEISPEVVQAARRFSPDNDHVLDNPRLSVVVEDAKSFLQLARRQYDLIISEPSNPWMAGVAGIFTREYYEDCRARLTTNGMMVQWFHIYECNNKMLQIVMSTFAAVFPYLNVWEGAKNDLILIGSLEPFKVDLAELERRFYSPGMQADFTRIHLQRLPVFLTQELVSQQNGLFIPEPGSPQHSDYFPTLEYVAQKAYFARDVTDFETAYNENYSARPVTLLARYLQLKPLTEADFQAFALCYATQQVPDVSLYRSVLQRWHKDFPRDARPLEISAQLSNPRSFAELEAINLSFNHEFIVTNASQNQLLLQYYAKHMMQTYLARRSVFYVPPTDKLQEVLDKLITLDAKNRRVHQLHLAELAWDRGDDATFLRLSQSALDPKATDMGPIGFELDQNAPLRVLTRLIETFWRKGDWNAAWDICQQAARNGYVGPQARHHNRILEMTCRRVEAFVQQARSEQASQ